MNLSKKEFPDKYTSLVVGNIKLFQTKKNEKKIFSI